jgi:hypothetical protein
LARKLGREHDHAARLLLYFLADIKLDQGRPVDADHLVHLCNDHFHWLPLDLIENRLEEWAEIEVLEKTEQSGTALYELRSFSFAQWLQLQGFTN